MLLDALIAELSCFSNDLLLCSALVSHAVLSVTVFFLQGQPLIFFTAGTELRLMLGGNKCSEGRWLSVCSSASPVTGEMILQSHSGAYVLISLSHED